MPCIKKEYPVGSHYSWFDDAYGERMLVAGKVAGHYQDQIRVRGTDTLARVYERVLYPTKKNKS